MQRYKDAKIQRYRDAKRENKSLGLWISGSWHLGFTLIELLVVVVVMAVIGTTVAGLFFQTLKGSTKATVIKEVRQNGDYALSVMEKMVRNAREVVSDCNGAPAASLTIKNQDNNQTTFACEAVKIASNSAANSAALTSAKVRVSSDCANFFTCTKDGSSPPLVEIKFSLSQAGSPTRPEEQASVDFRTTVSLRTY